MGRKILFVTTDQQRYDTLGCNGGTLARTPVVDALAAGGIRYERAVPQSVVCMPSRSTILTGQHPSTHGVWMNGVPLPSTRRRSPPTSRRRLPHRADRQGALRAVHGSVRPVHRELRGALGRGDASESPGRRHRRTAPRLRAPRVRHPRRRRDAALRAMADDEPPRGDRHVLRGDRRRVQGQRGGRRRHRRAAGEGQPDPARLVPHRLGRRSHDRLARRARRRRRLVLLDELPRSAPPVGPARSRRCGRVDWRDVPLPAGYPAERARPRGRSSTTSRGTGASGTTARSSRTTKRPRSGCRRRSPTTRCARSTPATRSSASSSTKRSVGCSPRSTQRGWTDDVDVIFTTDHGELQGDFGLLFKGPYHVDGLMRLPLVWRPAPSCGRRRRRP